MVTLDLSKVDRKTQGPLELEFICSLWSHLKPQTKVQLGRPKRLTQLNNRFLFNKKQFFSTMRRRKTFFENQHT